MLKNYLNAWSFRLLEAFTRTTNGPIWPDNVNTLGIQPGGLEVLIVSRSSELWEPGTIGLEGRIRRGRVLPNKVG